MQYGFYFDAARCGSCKACVMACKDKNNTLVGSKYRTVLDYGGGSWEDVDGCMTARDVFVYSVSFGCNHCAEPACVKACPAGAMTKREEDGIVYVDRSLCLGCGACAQACPYGAPHLDVDLQVMGKCDMCMDYLAEGKNPACVDACLMRCLEFGDIDELRAKHGDNADLAPLPSADLTKPSIVIGLPKDAGKQGEIISVDGELI